MGKRGFDWKEFFKPTKLKLSLTAILFITLPIIISVFQYPLDKIPQIRNNEYFIGFLSGIVLIIMLMKWPWGTELIQKFLKGALLSLLFSYILSCMLCLIYERQKNKKNKVILVIVISIILISSWLILYSDVFLYLVKSPKVYPSLFGPACMNVRLNIDSDFSCYNLSSKELQLRVFYQGDFTLKGLYFLVKGDVTKEFRGYSEEKNQNIRMLNGDYNSKLEVPTMNLRERNYSINVSGFNELDTVSVAGIIPYRLGTQTCQTITTMEIKNCAEEEPPTVEVGIPEWPW